MWKTCFLIGNHDASPEIYAKLYNEIERHAAKYGVDGFFVGFNGIFDRLAVRALNEYVRYVNWVEVTLVMHYLNKEKYDDIMHRFSGSIFPDGLEKVPPRYAIVKGNQLMVDKVDYLIAYNKDTTGNVDRLLNYARKREKRGELKITLIEPEK